MAKARLRQKSLTSLTLGDTLANPRHITGAVMMPFRTQTAFWTWCMPHYAGKTAPGRAVKRRQPPGRHTVATVWLARIREEASLVVLSGRGLNHERECRAAYTSFTRAANCSRLRGRLTRQDQNDTGHSAWRVCLGGCGVPCEFLVPGQKRPIRQGFARSCVRTGRSAVSAFGARFLFSVRLFSFCTMDGSLPRWR